MCDDRYAKCLVAYVNDAMAGVVVAFYNTIYTAEPSVEVRHLFVHHAHRSKKVAQALMQGLLDWEVSGDAPIFITTEGEPRPYYRALGFEPTHRICVSSLKKLREKLRG